MQTGRGLSSGISNFMHVSLIVIVSLLVNMCIELLLILGCVELGRRILLQGCTFGGCTNAKKCSVESLVGN